MEENLSRFHKLIHLAPNPIPRYQPELDTLPELLPDHVSFYQSLMGIYRWMIELVGVDILANLSMLSLHIVLPHQGH